MSVAAHPFQYCSHTYGLSLRGVDFALERDWMLRMEQLGKFLASNKG
jgi:hypothetical protein